MRRIAAASLVAVTTSTALIGLASPSVAAVPNNPIDPVVQVVQTALYAVDDLLCELLGNTLVCGG
ncbi:MAG: hypothetical protein QOC82_1926 [Frankiaceae bacterium]|nr:hypothetical protein [Frankiaceae bacterium]